MESDMKIIVTVSGFDKTGIVAKITTKLAEYNVNVEDIKQSICQGYFVMFLLGCIENSNYSFKEIKDALLEVGNELELEVWVQKRKIFDNMHKI